MATLFDEESHTSTHTHRQLASSSSSSSKRRETERAKGQEGSSFFLSQTRKRAAYLCIKRNKKAVVVLVAARPSRLPREKCILISVLNANIIIIRLVYKNACPITKKKNHWDTYK